MNRRNFIQTATLAFSLGSMERAWPAIGQALEPSTTKTPELVHFERMKVGVSFHFGMNTFTGNDYDEGTEPAATYAPSALNVEQWISTAALIGARYAILTAKHMSGFCLWNADNYDYDVAASGNHADVVGAFMAACKKHNIMPGLYYSILDSRNANRQGPIDWKSQVSAPYYGFILRQIKELHRRYKGIGLQVFDIPGKLSPAERWAIYRTVKSISPRCLVMMNQTWNVSQKNQGRISTPSAWPTDIMLSEDALPPAEGHDPWVVYEGNRYYMPMACWFPSGPFYKGNQYREWFWGPHFDTRSAAEMFDLYQKTVERKASFLLNLSPDTRGLLPDDAVRQMNSLAKLIAQSR
jgi:alpha-L-fucosidase